MKEGSKRTTKSAAERGEQEQVRIYNCLAQSLRSHAVVDHIGAYIQRRQRDRVRCHDRLSGFLIDLREHKGTLQESERVPNLNCARSKRRLSSCGRPCGDFRG